VVKNFSNKKEIHLACPICGYNLGPSKDKRSLEGIILQSELKSKTKDSASTPVVASAPKNGFKDPKPLKIDAKTVELRGNKSPQETKSGLPLEQKIDASKKNRPYGCNHYFGYLWTVPKGTKTPDECYSCARLIECYKEPKN